MLPFRGLGRLSQDRRGNAAAEFALILPAFLTLTMAVIQYGSMYVTYNTMLVSARDASREVAVGRQTPGNAANRAKGKRPNWVSSGNYAVTTQDSGVTDVQTTVTVPGDEAALLDILPSPDNLTVTVTMAKEA
jgi:Flp pilus assembly protein TadG